MPYGPQDEARYAKNREEFDKKYPPGSKRNRSGPSRIIARPSGPRPSIGNPEVIVEEVEVGGSNNNSQYITPNYQQHVFIALSLAFLLVLLAAYGRGQSKPKNSNQLLDPKTDPVKFGVSWLGLVIVLLAMASFRGTDKLAAAFSWLIFTAVVLVNGEQALSVFNKSVKPVSATLPPAIVPKPFGGGTGTGGGGAGGGF